MLKNTSQAWFNGLCKAIGIQARKPQRVRANLVKRDRDTQQLEQRVVLSAVSGVASDSGEKLSAQANQAETRSTLAGRIIKASGNKSLRRLQSRTKSPAAKSNVDKAQLRTDRLQKNRSRKAATHSNPGRRTGFTTTRRASKARATQPQNRSSVRTRTSLNAKKSTVSSSLTTPLKTSLRSSSSLRSKLSRVQSQSQLRQNSLTKTQTRRIRPGSLSNSSLIRSSRKSASRTTNSSSLSTVRKRTDSAVRKYTSSLKNRTISFGVHQRTSFSDRVANSGNVSFTDRIGKPSDFGLASGGNSYSSLDAFWTSFNRNYSRNPWHASANGLG